MPLVLKGSLSPSCDISAGSQHAVIVFGEKHGTSELHHVQPLLPPIIQALCLVNNRNNTSIRVLLKTRLKQKTYQLSGFVL